MAGGMGGMAPMHGAGMGGRQQEKKRNPAVAQDEELYTEDRPWTEAVIGNRRRRGTPGREGVVVTDDMHPEVAAVLKQAQRLQALMDEQLSKMDSESFTATDESETVEVTLNGHHWLKDVFIEEGLLRLGANTVEQRLNEALQNATADATASIDADRERLDAVVAEITADMTDERD